ncbi:hypothetical protein HRE53_27475 (plasmid) [Acaryochloris sp. 'Moss Beach']|uniref:hypothetical protein n=1 Tax=Acaryochloris sp. 'Moss Beach' TaxID=2740837 RepID=UPI001F3FF441|nr:hypothetical protein [Acaryochloris sp. 'Moss Beach']UJB72335.1 hypothetical protein HRE53_27475 [Acaryochloris sp. 'Moss Beach']
MAHNILCSSAILNDTSHRIITNCPNIWTVDFAVYRTGCGRTFGILNNETIKEFDCISELYPNHKGRGPAPSGLEYK